MLFTKKRRIWKIWKSWRRSGRIEELSIFRRYHRLISMPPLVFSCSLPFCSSYQVCSCRVIIIVFYFLRGLMQWITLILLLFNLSLLLVYAVRLARHTKSNTVLLSGLSGSGKTVLFYQVSVLASCSFFTLDGIILLMTFSKCSFCFVLLSATFVQVSVKYKMKCWIVLRLYIAWLAAPRWIITSGHCNINGT